MERPFAELVTDFSIRQARLTDIQLTDSPVIRATSLANAGTVLVSMFGSGYNSELAIAAALLAGISTFLLSTWAHRDLLNRGLYRDINLLNRDLNAFLTKYFNQDDLRMTIPEGHISYIAERIGKAKGVEVLQMLDQNHPQTLYQLEARVCRNQEQVRASLKPNDVRQTIESLLFLGLASKEPSRRPSFSAWSTNQKPIEYLAGYRKTNLGSYVYEHHRNRLSQAG